MILAFLTLALCVVYSGFILWCNRGWKGILKTIKKLNSAFITVDVIIAFRNEEQTIETLLEALANQNYSKNNYKVVLIDDHSDDHTCDLVIEFLANHPTLKSLLLKSEGHGKKSALAQAISCSEAEIILTTDADCIVGESWIKTMIEPFSGGEISFVAGPVVLSGGKGLFALLQKMEMIGLTGIAGASIANHRAMMCNGANLCYRRSVYNLVSGYRGSEFASGDDTQLMRKIYSEDPKQLAFIKDKNALVVSNAHSRLSDFWQQRRRWATKIPFTLSFFTVFIAIIAWFVHAALLLSFVTVWFFPENAVVFFASTLIKITVELLFLKKVSHDLAQKINPVSIILMQPVYWLYISLIGITVPFAGYRWKGRQVR